MKYSFHSQSPSAHLPSPSQFVSTQSSPALALFGSPGIQFVYSNESCEDIQVNVPSSAMSLPPIQYFLSVPMMKISYKSYTHYVNHKNV